MRISALERKVLNSIQEDMPLSPKPFEVLSKRLGIKEAVLLKKIRLFKRSRIIRNFSCHLDHRRLGFKSTLIALRVPLNKVDSIAKKLSKYPEVTHCYQRQGEFNLWLVFICPKEKRIKEFLGRLEKQIGKENIQNFETKKQYKLRTQCNL